MSASPEDVQKRTPGKGQTPEERLQALRYNHMMYGLTEGEQRMRPKRVDYGAPFLKHAKFASLLTAFRKGSSFQFDIQSEGRLYPIATDGSHLTYDGKTLFYARSLNKFEDSLFLDKGNCVRLQGNEAVVHLVFAILKSFPELGEMVMFYQHHKFYYGNDPLEGYPSEQGPNIRLGVYRHAKTPGKIRD